jgi:hypothetical protein
MEGLERIAGLSDSRLIEAVQQLASAERRAIALLVAALAELDARRLYLALGYTSLFDYCVRALHLSEQATYTRIEAARASRKFPAVLDRIADGGLSLTAARLIAPHLRDDNCEALLRMAHQQKTRDVERMIATIRPSPAVPSIVRKLPQRTQSQSFEPQARLEPQAPLEPQARIEPDAALTRTESTTPADSWIPPASHRPVIQPLSPTFYRLQITIEADAHDKLREAQALLRHVVPNGDPAIIFTRALDALIAQLRKGKFGEVTRPRESQRPSSGRTIPADVRRKVAARDGRQCAYVAPDGVRCVETGFLEFHHVVPYARGGAATAENIQLRCRAHNQYAADLDFG